jgi:hypothetical protein
MHCRLGECIKESNKGKREKWHDVKLVQRCYESLCMSITGRLWNISHIYMSNSTACNRLAVVMGGVFWRGGSWGVIKFITIAWLKMEDAYILCNVIETFWRKKVTKVKRWIVLIPFKLKWHRHNCVRTHRHVCVNNQILQLLSEGID